MTCEFEIVDHEKSDGRVLKTSLDSKGEDSSVAGVGSDDSSGDGVGGVGSEGKRDGTRREGVKRRKEVGGSKKGTNVGSASEETSRKGRRIEEGR